MKAPKILSLSFDSEKLKRREDALRLRGFEVKSVASPGQARFEMEMGQCGVFVTCAAVSEIVNQDLMKLFRTSCLKDGLIIYFEHDDSHLRSIYSLPADVRLPMSRDPEGIIETLESRPEFLSA